MDRQILGKKLTSMIVKVSWVHPKSFGQAGIERQMDRWTDRYWGKKLSSIIVKVSWVHPKSIRQAVRKDKLETLRKEVLSTGEISSTSRKPQFCNESLSAYWIRLARIMSPYLKINWLYVNHIYKISSQQDLDSCWNGHLRSTG